jgi:hypothetical protein
MTTRFLRNDKFVFKVLERINAKRIDLINSDKKFFLIFMINVSIERDNK